ncbi:TARSH protein, partial [Eudromia elegans]|nr:TARSH protein [Eudromia elegans]
LSPVKRQSLKVQINATDDTVCMKYLRPSQNTKLEGFVLGYGSSFFSNQYIPLPSEGKSYTAELDAEHRYLISVRPARNSNSRKSCSGRSKSQKPLQLVVGTLTPTSVFLSWGILVNPQHDWTATSNCASDRFYTVRYREKDKEKKWVFQLCPVTETVVDNLKPNTIYEFGVKDNIEDSVWSKTLNHKTVLSNKKVNGQLQNMYKLVPNGQTQLTLRDNKKLVPVTIIKQGVQIVHCLSLLEFMAHSPLCVVHLIVPGLNETQQKLPPPLTIDDLSQAAKKKMAKNETQPWPAESKTPEVQEISPQALPAETEKNHGPEEFKSTPKPELEQTQSILASNEIQPHPPGSRIYDAPKSPLTELATQSPALKSISLPPVETKVVQMAFDKTQPVSSRSKASGTTGVQPTKSARGTAELEISMPVITTEPHFLGTAMGKTDKLKFSLQFLCLTVATLRPGLESPSTASLETARAAMATQEPVLKSTSLPSMKTRGTVMAFDEKQPVSSRSETSGIQEMPSATPGNICRFSVISLTISLISYVKLVLLYHQQKIQLLCVEHCIADKVHYKNAKLYLRIMFIDTVTCFFIAFDDIQPVLPSPETPSSPEIAEPGPATSESILESFTPKTPRPFQWPRVTLAPKETPLTPSKLKPSVTPEVHHVKPALKPPLFEHSTPKTSQTSEQPKATLAPKEAKPIPSTSKSTPSARTKKPRIKPAPKETHRIPSKPKSPPKLHIPHATGVLESVTFRTDEPKTAIVPKETHRFPPKPKTSPSSEVPHTKPVLDPIMFRTEKPKSTVAPRETRRGPPKPKTPPPPRVPPTRASPKESRRVSSKPKATPSPEIPQTKPAPKDLQHTPFKPKAAPIPDASYTKPEIIPPFHEPVTTMIPHIPERTKATLAPTEKQLVPIKPKAPAKPRVPHTKPAIHQTTPQPLITKSSTTTEQTRATMAPKETLLIPSKPKTSVRPEVPQTKPAPRTTHLGSINLITVHVVDGSKMTLVPNETYQLLPRPKSPLATEFPHFFLSAPHKTRLTSARPKPSDKSQTRPALSRTTLAPSRTRTPGLPKWIAPATDDVYTPEDIVKLIGVDIEKPKEHIDTWEKRFSVTTSPGPHRPPVPPVRPTQMRRKPLPPSTVTGKPGSPAKPAGPTTLVKTGVPYKTPTASATPDYYVDATVFSSSPTSETDSSGKPRYQAPHVKYMKKDDDVPCSITSSLEHFPQEEGGSKEEAIRPPQNPPTNLTVVTVEGCPTFVILDWEKPDNDTVTEYEVVSTENGASDGEKEQSIITTNQTHSTVENLKPDTSYEFHVKPRNPLGEGPSSNVVAFNTESADPRVSEPISMGKDAIWTEIPFNSDTYSECKGKQYVKRTWYKKFVGVQLCNSLRYKIYLSDSLTGKFYNIGDQRGHGEDHCQFVDSFLDGRTGQQDDLPVKDGFFRAVRQEPVKFGKIGGETHINYVRWYECGTSIPGKW